MQASECMKSWVLLLAGAKQQECASYVTEMCRRVSFHKYKDHKWTSAEWAPLLLNGGHVILEENLSLWFYRTGCRGRKSVTEELFLFYSHLFCVQLNGFSVSPDVATWLYYASTVTLSNTHKHTRDICIQWLEYCKCWR